MNRGGRRWNDMQSRRPFLSLLCFALFLAVKESADKLDCMLVNNAAHWKKLHNYLTNVVRYFTLRSYPILRVPGDHLG